MRAWRFQYSLNSLLLVVTATAAYLAVSRVVRDYCWPRHILRILGPVVLAALLLRYCRKPGPKIDGLISVLSMLSFHATLWIGHVLFCCIYGWGYHRNHQLEPSQLLVIPAVLAVMITHVSWIAFAVLAIKSRKAPNVQIGILCAIALLTPYSLEALDEWCSILCASMGWEWEPQLFTSIYDVLWIW